MALLLLQTGTQGGEMQAGLTCVLYMISRGCLDARRQAPSPAGTLCATPGQACCCYCWSELARHALGWHLQTPVGARCLGAICAPICTVSAQ